MLDKGVTIGADLDPKEEKELICIVNKNKDVFAWLAKDLQGVDQDIIEHVLDTDERITPKSRALEKCLKKRKAVEAKVQRLQDAKVIKEIMYPLWSANTILVK
jgi:hypothetical protein